MATVPTTLNQRRINMKTLLIVALSLATTLVSAAVIDQKIDPRGYWLDRSFATHTNWAIQDNGSVNANVNDRCVVIMNPKRNEIEVLYKRGSRYLNGQITRSFERNGFNVVESVFNDYTLRLSINKLNLEARVLLHKKGQSTEELCSQAKDIR